MKIAELPPDEQEQIRKYNREAKAKSREKRKAAETLTAQEWCDQFLASPEHEEVRLFAESQHKQIAQELGIDDLSWSRHPAWYEVDATIWSFYGFQKNFVRQVTEPNGVVVSGIIFPDAIGSRIVAATHQYKLERSQAFSVIYRELLQTLDQRFGRHLSEDPIEKRAALDVKAELAGIYVLPEQI